MLSRRSNFEGKRDDVGASTEGVVLEDSGMSRIMGFLGAAQMGAAHMISSPPSFDSFRLTLLRP